MLQRIFKNKLIETNGKTCFPYLLPKEFTPSDYDISNDVIELEEKSTGNRFWIKTNILFDVNFEIGKNITIVEFNQGWAITYNYCFKNIEISYIKKRYYLLAILEKL